MVDVLTASQRRTIFHAFVRVHEARNDGSTVGLWDGVSVSASRKGPPR